MDRTGHETLERYGMAELIIVTSNPCDGPRRPGTVGLALPGVDVRIMGHGGKEDPPHKSGLLRLKEPNLPAECWRNPGRTAEEHAAGCCLVSAAARRDRDGSSGIVGRSRDLIILGAFNVYAKEVELVTARFQGSGGVAVIGVPHSDFGGSEGVVAVVVTKPGVVVDRTELRAATLCQPAAYKHPKAVTIVDGPPRTECGQVFAQS